jgi:uncharacterized damage-inducible protein DinB
MRPEQAKFLLNFLLPQLKSEQAVTKRILCAIPPDCGEYRPNAKCMTAIQLAWHLSVVEIWFLDAVIQRQFGKTAPRPAKLNTTCEVAQWHEENVAQRVPLLEALSGEALITPVDFIGLRNDPAVAYLNIAIRHSVHHRGQLSTYLRAMGAKVPAIYVESAGEPYTSTDGNAARGTQPSPAF